MAIPEPHCNDGPNELLRKILLGLPDISGGGGGDVQSGNEPIANGSDTVSVVFPTAFSAPPDVIVSVSRPVGESLIDSNVDTASVTAVGFTASLGGAPASANYTLSWIANLP